MGEADDLTDRDNWLGGAYELAVETGDPDPVLRALWAAAGVEGCFVLEDGRYREAPVAIASTESHSFRYGRLVLPTGQRVVCLAVLTCGVLAFGVPAGALGRAGVSIGESPRGVAGSPALDTWLAGVAFRAHARVPFGEVVIGFEAAALGDGLRLIPREGRPRVS